MKYFGMILVSLYENFIQTKKGIIILKIQGDPTYEKGYRD